MPKYLWKDEPQTDFERNMLLYAHGWVLNRLSQEEQEHLITEFRSYMDTEHEQGNAIIPAYIWTLNRIELVIKPNTALPQNTRR